MIQRIQSLYLLAASVCAWLSFKFPFYTGERESIKEQIFVTAQTNFIILILSAFIGAGSLVIIFLYKNRKQQRNFTLISLALSVVSIILYFNEIKDMKGTLSLTAIIIFALPVLLLMAYYNIRKDEKLVKSLERLR